MGLMWRCVPFVGAHPPVEHADRPVAQAGDDEGALGVAGQARDAAVRSGRDVLVHRHTQILQ